MFLRFLKSDRGLSFGIAFYLYHFLCYGLQQCEAGRTDKKWETGGRMYEFYFVFN